jgi:SOS-response transcriptional repressor LexA
MGITRRDAEKRRAEILRFVYQFTADNKGMPPTIREITEGCEIESTNTVHLHLSNLIENGYLEKVGGEGRSRGISIPGAVYYNPALPDWALENGEMRGLFRGITNALTAKMIESIRAEYDAIEDEVVNGRPGAVPFGFGGLKIGRFENE